MESYSGSIRPSVLARGRDDLHDLRCGIGSSSGRVGVVGVVVVAVAVQYGQTVFPSYCQHTVRSLSQRVEERWISGLCLSTGVRARGGANARGGIGGSDGATPTPIPPVAV